MHSNLIRSLYSDLPSFVNGQKDIHDGAERPIKLMQLQEFIGKHINSRCKLSVMLAISADRNKSKSLAPNVITYYSHVITYYLRPIGYRSHQHMSGKKYYT